jgi:hypothetical protein
MKLQLFSLLLTVSTVLFSPRSTRGQTTTVQCTDTTLTKHFKFVNAFQNTFGGAYVCAKELKVTTSTTLALKGIVHFAKPSAVFGADLKECLGRSTTVNLTYTVRTNSEDDTVSLVSPGTLTIGGKPVYLSPSSTSLATKYWRLTTLPNTRTKPLKVINAHTLLESTQDTIMLIEDPDGRSVSGLCVTIPFTISGVSVVRTWLPSSSGICTLKVTSTSNYKLLTL